VKVATLALLLLVAGCSSFRQPVEAPSPAPAPVPAPAPAQTTAPPSKGGYYKDDGPGANPPANLASIPNAVPRAEPLHRYANRPYQALGKDYVPMAGPAPFRQSGIGSWYGRRFHGLPTSSGEKYDMYAMTAAHPTLPIPSYVRVTNPANGRSVVVRVNDRGPFHANRIIDLSYVAAWKLGYVEAGSARVEVEVLLPGAPEPLPALTTVASPPPATEAKSDSVTGVRVQLGAYSSREAAENLRVRVYRELAWLADPMHVVPGGGMFRVQLGPYPTPEQARSVADRIQSELGLRPAIVGR
jgi:rare lipoprotein A